MGVFTLSTSSALFRKACFSAHTSRYLGLLDLLRTLALLSAYTGKEGDPIEKF
jgi:hypothetical protein